MKSSRSRTAPPAASRRVFLRAGLATVGSLTLPGILQLRAASCVNPPDTAVIFIQLGGGPSQFETYDPKPDAPVEYRGAFGTICTNVTGVRFCETMPRQARLMKDLAIIRSVSHHEASHIALHVVETGYFLRNSANALAGEMPSIGSVVARVRGDGTVSLPGFVALPRHFAYCSPGYLGGRYAPFNVNSDPNTDDFRVANLALRTGLTPGLLQDRRMLLRSFDSVPRVLDHHDSAQAMTAFQSQALDLLTGTRARLAFDLGQEPVSVRDGYGRTDFGQRLLLARRLVEAGVPFVMIRNRPGDKLSDWDDHKGLARQMQLRAPGFDQAIAALIEDLRQRGLTRQVLVVAMGEFGRTPKVNAAGGRDHWPAVASVLLAGGNYRMGQIVGASDSRGATVQHAPYPPQSVLMMVYHHLGIDPAMTFPDLTGRPRHILEVRRPIRELL